MSVYTGIYLSIVVKVISIWYTIIVDITIIRYFGYVLPNSNSNHASNQDKRKCGFHN